jgi:hypothetical protein
MGRIHEEWKKPGEKRNEEAETEGKEKEKLEYHKEKC